MSHPDAVVPWQAFGLHWLDPESMAHCSAAQAVAALHLVGYDPHLHNHSKEAQLENLCGCTTITAVWEFKAQQCPKINNFLKMYLLRLERS